MNSYFLSISGFWWVLVVLAAVAVAFTVFSYTNTIPPISKSKKIFLITLRSTAIIILLFAIFEPIWTSINAFVVKPKIAVLFDNSISMGIDDAAGNRKQRYKELVDKIDFSAFGKDILYYQFSDDAKQIDINNTNLFNFDSLKLDGNMTDISKAIRTVNNIAEATNTRAILLITDGAFNAGNNPIFDAENFAKPIYTVGFGDTTEPKDIAITSLLLNEIAYIENPIPITVNFNSVGYNGDEVTVSLLDNGQKFAEQIFKVNSERTNYTAIFEYNPKSEGIRKITANISTLPNEITDKNNTHSEYVKVLKNSRTVAIFAGYPSPDFAFIKRVLQEEKGVEILEFVQKQGSEFYKTPTQQQISKADVIVFCAFPINSTPTNILTMIGNELNHNKSFLFIAGLTTDYNKLKTIDEYLPFQLVNSRQQEFLVSPLVNVEALANPLLRITGTDEDISLWNRLPPIFRTETFVKVKPESEVVATMKVNNVELKDPLIMTRDFQGKKSVAIMGYGLFRWKMLGYASSTVNMPSNTVAEIPDLFETLINNTYRWLSVNERSKQVNIRTTKKHYNQGEKIEFIGELYDASFVPIEGGNIKITVGAGENKREIIMNSIGNGRYYGSVEGLAQGDYSFSAVANIGARNLGSDDGRFSIGELAIEYQNLKQNVALLKSISERTLGRYFTVDEISEIANEVRKSNSFTEKPVTLQSEFHLWNWLGFLVIAILLFAFEWVIRKRTGLL